MKNNFTVADFFCGAGGFSEGFRLAGFDVVFALDNWDIARHTHKLNHPKSKHPGLDCFHETRGDILSIPPERVDEIVDDTDVIVGSPPCVSFSSSNRAGKADKSLGIKLIEKYFQIVAIKKHKKNSVLKYWIMENVPNARKFIKKSYTFKEIGLNNKILKKLKIRKKENDVALEINSSSKIYNSVYFGVPQKRKRFFCGDFPIPKKKTKSREETFTLGMVLDSLRPNGNLKKDPLYNFTINDNELTDHYYDTTIPELAWKQAKLKKQQARYYGRMSFPENEKAPSRTIMATKSNMTREAMIFHNGKPNVYRAPTIREIASIMSFPITYLFQGNNELDKYRLVGNAVCPKMAFAFAEAILLDRNKKPKLSNPVKRDNKKLFLDLRKSPPSKITLRDKHKYANFAEIVPDLKISGFRVELDNGFPRKKNKINWNASLHHATGRKNMKKCICSLDNVYSIIKTYKNNKKINYFIKDVRNIFAGKIPNRKKFQEMYCRVNSDKKYHTPYDTLEKIKELVDRHFPEDKYDDIFLMNNKKKGQFLKFDKKIPGNKIPLRILLAFYAVTFITEAIKKY